MTIASSPHNFADGAAPMHVHHSDIGTVFFYSDFLVTEFNEGVTVNFKTGMHLLLTALKYIGAKPIYIISNRKKSYSVQPNDYKYLNSVPNLKGIAIVTQDDRRASNAKLEANFYKKHFEVFSDLNTAKQWGDALLTAHKIKSK